MSTVTVESATKYVRAFRDGSYPKGHYYAYIADLGYDCGFNGFGSTAAEAKREFINRYLHLRTPEQLRQDVRLARLEKKERQELSEFNAPPDPLPPDPIFELWDLTLEHIDDLPRRIIPRHLIQRIL